MISATRASAIKHTNSLALFLTAILFISWSQNVAAARPDPLDTDSPNESNPSPKFNRPKLATAAATATNEIDDSTAMELYTQWLESTSGARSTPSTDHNHDQAPSFSQGFTNFKDTLTRITEINTNPDIHWTAGLTSRANLPTGKHYPLMNIDIKSPAPPPNATDTSRRAFVAYKGPPVVDYWGTGKVTPIKTQGNCGSCWAFSTMAAIESKLMISGGPETDLSEQFLVNCDSRSRGCIGGYLESAIKVVQERGAPLETDLPYLEIGDICTLEQPKRVTISGWGLTTPFSSSSIMTAILKYGPVTFIFDVAKDFELYKSGVYSSSNCSRTGARSTSAHAMVIVGFNTTSDPPYWIVRNSWDTSWGMDGYAYIKMEPDNNPGECSMYFYPMYYPLSARLVDANENGIDVALEQPPSDQQGDREGQKNDEVPRPPPPIICTGYGDNNYKIIGKPVIKTVWAKNFDACGAATAANKGGIFNFSKITKMCTILKGSWDDISGNLVRDKTMMAGFPACLPVES